MDLFFQILIFGSLAAFMFILSAGFAMTKRHMAGLLFGVLELLAAAVSSGTWAYALKISGKIDWFLLGIFSYTPIALICAAMFAAGVWCAAVNLRGFLRRPTSTSPDA